jgi:6-phospho-beta-glucosidase
MRAIVADIEAVAPRARIFNYTNPVNIVAEAVTHHSPVPIVSLCEGPVHFPRALARAADLDPAMVTAVMVGLNHNCWSVTAEYDGGPLMPLVEGAWRRRRDDPAIDPHTRRWLHLAATMGAVPADYFLYYYFREEIVAELQARRTTRAEDIMAEAPGYWDHYREQSEADRPVLDPARSRGGLHELELAVDVMDAVFNARDEVHTVNVPNRGSLPGFPDDLVVEVPARCGRDWIEPLAVPPLPRQVSGLVQALGEYQALAAEAAWNGRRLDGVRALASNPLVPTLPLAEAIYDEMAAAHRRYLPARLLS